MSMFDSIKVGDKVVRTQPYNARHVVEVVTHVTPKRFRAGGFDFVKATGRALGVERVRATRIATAEDIVKQRRQRSRDFIRLSSAHVLTDEQLDAFADLFEKCGVVL